MVTFITLGLGVMIGACFGFMIAGLLFANGRDD